MDPLNVLEPELPILKSNSDLDFNFLIDLLSVVAGLIFLVLDVIFFCVRDLLLFWLKVAMELFES